MTKFNPPSGPGVRLDSGVETGSVVGGQFDPLLAKLIVYGANRQEALARARRALDEFEVEGLATVIPFHRAIVRDPAFIGDENGFSVHTRWIETEWNNTIEPFTGGEPLDEEDARPRQKVVVEVGGRRLEVSLPPTWRCPTAPVPTRSVLSGANPSPQARRARGRRGLR
ncbi:biotin carboxylase C-terminal domain protein [Mycobacterium xenopi 3993]|nr:biotin carboxylase C-terminal domain protein [Mycobacterium xenopi 3993]